MTLKEFLELNYSNHIDIWLYYNDHFVDGSYKHNLEDSIYINKKVKSFVIEDNELHINLEDF